MSAETTRASMSGQLRSVRMIHFIMLAAVACYIFLAEKLARSSTALPSLFPVAFGIVAFLDVLISYGFRAKMLNSAAEILRRDPGNAAALLRWRKAQILTMTLMLSVTLLGFALRFLAGSLLVSLPFYVTSVALLLIWRPRDLTAQL